MRLQKTLIMQNEPNGMLFKTHSKPKNGDFGIFRKPFYAKRTQWYVYGKSMRRQKTLNIPNKANLKIDPMTITNVLTIDYNRMDTWYRGKNKAKTKPICVSPAPTLRLFRKVGAGLFEN